MSALRSISWAMMARTRTRASSRGLIFCSGRVPVLASSTCRVPLPRPYSRESGPHAGGNKIWSFSELKNEIRGTESRVTIIDTREQGEVKVTGKIPGALNIPITSSPDSFHIDDEAFQHRNGFRRPAKSAELVMYCKAGVRSRAAAALARDAGWTNVGEYPGSWQDWERNHGPVLKAKETMQADSEGRKK